MHAKIPRRFPRPIKAGDANCQLDVFMSFCPMVASGFDICNAPHLLQARPPGSGRLAVRDATRTLSGLNGNGN